ncbi:uncharacterized protein LOC123308336 [Coccinella septempunctata]|uniref:uncharacterized protein LOC123308336 n=1 Tax=Coccinella septempunctata TaxID=41139 RepID=UPI001D073A57|nr:uncharacterized protein LOC123308336 [Coccinella septempunctata]
MRARSTISRRVSSGSSAEQKLHAERIRRNHKHFELLTFLDKTLATRPTISNLESTSGNSTPADSPPRSPLFHETPSTSRGRQGEPSSSRGRQGQLSLQDEAFLEAIKELRPMERREATPIEQFCSRLADGLSKLPRNVSNNLQVEFLTKLVEQENIHL